MFMCAYLVPREHDYVLVYSKMVALLSKCAATIWLTTLAIRNTRFEAKGIVGRLNGITLKHSYAVLKQGVFGPPTAKRCLGYSLNENEKMEKNCCCRRRLVFLQNLSNSNKFLCSPLKLRGVKP